MKILFASSNQGKIGELNLLFGGTGHELVSTNSDGFQPFDVPENGSTFSENAFLKARAYAERYGLPSLADDSGLEVIALDNRPGVASNRWFGGSDSDRNIELLRLLQDQENRTARFVTLACLYFPDTKNCHFFEGSVDGTISDAPRGKTGFGYDPIFIPQGFDKTFAELGIEEKNKLSHRARAFAQAKIFLSSL